MTTVYGRYAAYGLGADPAMHWAESAKCLGMARPEVMWPLPGADAQIAEAIKVCDGCPSRVPCLLDGIDENEFDSVRGGLTGRQRKLAARAHGRDIAAYLKPEPPQRHCVRCGQGFVVDEAVPTAHICPACAFQRDRIAYQRRVKREVRQAVAS